MARSRPSSSSRSRHTGGAPPPSRPQSHTNSQSAHGAQHNTHQTSSAQPQPQVTNVYVQRGGGVGGAGAGLLGTVASVAAGSVLGHGISNMLFSRDQPPAQPAQAQEVARQVGDGACAPQINLYSKCLEANEGHPESCKWVWESFLQCQEKQ